jgi:hypothetical protein
MTRFDDFKAKFQPILVSRQADPRVVRDHAARLPTDLLNAWTDLGWGGFGNGKLWLTDPAELEFALDLFLQEPEGAIAFARTGFGNVYYLRGNDVKLIDVHYGKQYEVVNIEGFFSSYVLSEEASYDDMMADLYDEAVLRLGAPSPNEMFAFVPALALGGGEPSIDLVQRMAWREHLAILAGIHLG